MRQNALERLNELGISTTLVVTVKRGSNDDELGKIIEYAVKQPCVRGVVFQPVQVAGRVQGFDPARDRLTLTRSAERRILEQTKLFQSGRYYSGSVSSGFAGDGICVEIAARLRRSQA